MRRKWPLLHEERHGGSYFINTQMFHEAAQTNKYDTKKRKNESAKKPLHTGDDDDSSI